MPTDLLPTLAMLVVAGWFIRQHRGLPVLQVYALIVTSYLNIFPALDLVFSNGEGMNGFFGYQCLIIAFFELPLLIVAHQMAPRWRRSNANAAAAAPPRARLSALLPVVLGLMLVAFWFVALRYDLFFRRLGHEGLLRNTAEVPSLLLYLYRGAVETAFFVMVFLWTVLRCVRPDSRRYREYQIVLAGYLGTFVLFFAANSRMQFVLLLLCLICTQPPLAQFLLKPSRLLRFGLLLAVLVFGLTLFRELYLEDNDRIATGDLSELLLAAGWLIAARLDSVVIMYRMHDAGFNPLGFDLSGVMHVLNFYASFFTDPATYASIKESLVTSISVEVVNRRLSASEVDFPKSMILDMFLSFGVTGLVITAIALGSMVGRVQGHLKHFHGFTPALMVSLYALPMLLEFEKEFMGLFFAFLKWTPMLALLYLERPRFASQRRARRIEVPPAAGAPAGASGTA